LVEQLLVEGLAGLAASLSCFGIRWNNLPVCAMGGFLYQMVGSFGGSPSAGALDGLCKHKLFIQIG